MKLYNYARGYKFLKWFSAKLTVMDEELKLRFVVRSGIVTGFWVLWSKTFTSWPSRPSLHKITLDILIQRLFDFNCMEMTKWCRYFGSLERFFYFHWWINKAGESTHLQVAMIASEIWRISSNLLMASKWRNVQREEWSWREGQMSWISSWNCTYFSCKTWLTSFSAFVCIFNQRPLWEKNEAQIITKHRKNKQTRSWKNAAKLAIDFLQFGKNFYWLNELYKSSTILSDISHPQCLQIKASWRWKYTIQQGNSLGEVSQGDYHLQIHQVTLKGEKWHLPH